ncbi:MAG TPA: hypothetical protein VGI98_08200, partial [Candidatus Limnocylindrales bacterium]
AAGGITATTLVVGATVAVVIAAIAIWAIRTWMRSRLPPPPPAGRGAGGGAGRSGGPVRPTRRDPRSIRRR